MTQFIQRIVIGTAFLCLSLAAAAYDFEVDGIYYNILSLGDLTCEVTYNDENVSTQYMFFDQKRGTSTWETGLKISYPSYKDNVVVPSKVKYKAREFSVIGIGEYAFLNCRNLKSLTLPFSITQIAEVLLDSKYDCYAGAFDYCSIENLTVGNAYTLQMFNQSYASDYNKTYRTRDNLKHLELTDDFEGKIEVDFSDYNKLVSIQSKVIVPPTFSNGIHFSSKQFVKIQVSVPSNEISKYKSAPYWSNFWEIDGIGDAPLHPLSHGSYDFELDGIFYNILSVEDFTCEVTYDDVNRRVDPLTFLSADTSKGTCGNSSTMYSVSFPSYSGRLVIPSEIKYKGAEFSVVAIGADAFLNCQDLKTLSLPASITRIEEGWCSVTKHPVGAFDYCGIEELIVGNEYTLQMFSQSYASNPENQTINMLKNLVLSDDFTGIIGVDFSKYTNLSSIRSDANETPVFSSDSLFTKSQYLNMEILVPEESFTKYLSADVWKYFMDFKIMKSVSMISLNESNVTLEPTQTFQLVSIVLPEDAFDSTINWTSSNPTVATVDDNGMVTALTKGDAVIYASSVDGSGITAECRVHVDRLVKELNLSETEIILEPGESKKINAAIKPMDALVQEIIWTSDAENIATVDNNGNITAKNVGIANITAKTTDGSDLTASCKVIVAELVKSIEVTPNEVSITEGEILQLSCLVAPETATNKEVVWKSSNPEIATVNASGEVYGVYNGSTEITAFSTDGSKVYGESSVTVLPVIVEVNGICYQRNSPSSIKVVANLVKPYNGNFVIPATTIFNGTELEITEIAADAFAGCGDLTRIVIPASVTRINDGAFKDCSNLSYVKICDGSSLSINMDETFHDSPINEIYVGSKNITYNSTSRILGNLKGLTLSGNVTAFPPKQVFKSLEYFVVENGNDTMIEPEEYCSKSQSLINQMTINDPYTKIMYRYFWSVTYQHLSPIFEALENSILNYIDINREIQKVEVDTSKTQEKIPTTAGSRYQEYGYVDEHNYSYREMIVKSDYNRYPIESISFETSEFELETGKSMSLAVIFNPRSASYTPIVWSSSDENIAVVDAFGMVTKIASGKAEITAAIVDGSNLSAKCMIIDPKPFISVTALEITPSETRLEIGQTLVMTPVITPNDATNQVIVWASSNPTVASVDDSGLVTAIAEGDTELIASTTDGSNLSAMCRLKVEKPVIGITQIEVTPAKVQLEVGEKFHLMPVITPNRATNQTIAWTSTNPAVACVTSNGEVEAVESGEATIVATTQDGSNLSASCQVTVVEKTILVESINLSSSKIEGVVSETYNIDAIVLPEDATNKALKWTSSDESVATIEDGIVKLNSLGTAIISVEALDGSNVKAECTVIVADEVGIDSIIADKNEQVKIFDMKGYLIYDGPYSDANLSPGFYVMIYNGECVKAKI